MVVTVIKVIVNNTAASDVPAAVATAAALAMLLLAKRSCSDCVGVDLFLGGVAVASRCCCWLLLLFPCCFFFSFSVALSRVDAASGLVFLLETEATNG